MNRNLPSPCFVSLLMPSKWPLFIIRVATHNKIHCHFTDQKPVFTRLSKQNLGLSVFFSCGLIQRISFPNLMARTKIPNFSLTVRYRIVMPPPPNLTSPTWKFLQWCRTPPLNVTLPFKTLIGWMLVPSYCHLYSTCTRSNKNCNLCLQHNKLRQLRAWGTKTKAKKLM